MSTIPASPTNESAYELFDRWLEHWQRERHPLPTREPAAAVAPPTQEAGTSPLPASPAAAAPLPRTEPSGEDSGLVVLKVLTEHLIRTSDPFGPGPSPTDVGPEHPRSVPRSGIERQVGGAILRFPGRSVPTSRPSLTAPGAVRPRAVPAEERLAALECATPAPGLVLFSPRAGIRPVLTAGFGVAAACTGVSVVLARIVPTGTTLALTAALAVLTGLLWSARTRATGTTVTIEDGVLKVAQGADAHQFPLTGVHPPIDILGEPGHRGWRVLIGRRGRKPYVVDSRMVDPVEFTEAIRRFRPRA